MNKIKILPQILSNKIAAGEVVERPASVVKELIENSIDATSTRIEINIKDGGKSLISISDNGKGMSYDDACLSIERFATSKIYNDDDLFSIKTLGFRGEALPSITSVSRFTMITKNNNSEHGTKVVINGGKIDEILETGAPNGTMIKVKDLFYNIPARRKFLKTNNTEMGHIIETISSIALGWPNIQFKLMHNENTIKSWTKVNNPFDRIVDVLGKDTISDLYMIKSKNKDINIMGWISSARVFRKTARGIYLYVNGRYVKSKIIQHALLEGYGNRLMKGQFPYAVIHIEVPLDQVDVNVHPTKSEVRFIKQKIIHDIIVYTASNTLNEKERPSWDQTDNKNQVWDDIKYKPKKASVCEQINSFPDIMEYKTKFKNEMFNGPKDIIKQNYNINYSFDQTKIFSKIFFKDLEIIGQIHNTYIICESTQGIILIDQHAAHERIVFEELKKNIKNNKTIISQQLLIPETFEPGYKEANVLKELINDLLKFGIEIDPFGGNTFVIKSIPTILEGKDIKNFLIEMIEKMIEIGYTSGLESATDEYLMLIACHSSIRANQKLQNQEIQALLNQLDKCDNPSYCPHGRPLWIKWTKTELEKMFKRIVT